MALTFDLSPYNQTIDFIRQRLGIEAREQDLILAHVTAHSSDLAHGGIGLVISVGFWTGEPVPAPDPATLPARRWCAPGHPPVPLGAWDGAVMPSLMTTSVYTEIGWTNLPVTPPDPPD
ncbi:hypothetical protein [Frankia sp. AvcI1]|uniref:hypothetical protein n=1 Tax=Frankia sp. AvcI1 TaxID=573496 RepID=UPI001F30EF73|nr:hypothetical protein [Frankia sp. AvcI1]